MSQPNYTLCWECKKATGKCRWSSELKPVPGWTAKPTKQDSILASYIVFECPLFERDAVNFGLKRYPIREEETKRHHR